MKLSVDVKLSVVELATAFCELDDEQQAQFFIESARIAESWDGAGRVMQWHSVGRHLATCVCSTYEAREMVRSIADSVEAER